MKGLKKIIRTFSGNKFPFELQKLLFTYTFVNPITKPHKLFT